MIILEQATAGGCFQGVNEQAFRLHVVTRGIDIPTGLDADVRVLLRGLLARDPLKRWAAPQLFAWLKGEPVSAEDMPERPVESGPTIALNERSYTSPDLFSLAAAGSDNWNAAPRSGDAWCGRHVGCRSANSIRERLRKCDVYCRNKPIRGFSPRSLLMAINPALPLTLKGEIVTPAWLLSYPQDGY